MEQVGEGGSGSQETRIKKTSFGVTSGEIAPVIVSVAVGEETAGNPWDRVVQAELQRRISDPLIEEAVERENFLLEKGGFFTLSKVDFETYFPHSEMAQSQLRDCGYIASIRSLADSPHFEMICRSSMKRNEDGSWVVKMPLFDSEGEAIMVTQDDLLPKDLGFFERITRFFGNKGTFLATAGASEGIRVLEAALIIKKFGKMDLRKANRGAFPKDLLDLLGGRNFRNSHFCSKKGLNFLSPGAEEELDLFLASFDPEIHLATAISKSLIFREPYYYRAKGTILPRLIVSNHAYAVSQVDTENKRIFLRNPWETYEELGYSFDEFKLNFAAISCVRIDTARVLEEMDKIKPVEAKNN